MLIWAAYLYIISSTGHFDYRVAMRDCTLSVGILALSAWGICLLINAYPTPVAILLYAIIISAVLCLAGTLSAYFILKFWLGSRYPLYGCWLAQALTVRMLLHFTLLGWISYYYGLSKKVNTLQDKFKMQADASILLREAELFKLRRQLQPHFLYNSLNSINALILIQPGKAQEMIGKLSDFLRSSVKREAQDRIPVDEELIYIQSYLDIESIRFGDRLIVLFDKELH